MKLWGTNLDLLLLVIGLLCLSLHPFLQIFKTAGNDGDMTTREVSA